MAPLHDPLAASMVGSARALARWVQPLVAPSHDIMVIMNRLSFLYDFLSITFSVKLVAPTLLFGGK